MAEAGRRRVTIKIVPNERGIPQAKLADAEMVFEDGLLSGLKLVGFSVWEGREGRHVTFPSRPFLTNGERRSYSMLRPVGDPSAQEPLRQLILQAFVDFQHRAAALLAQPLTSEVDDDKEGEDEDEEEEDEAASAVG
jgi:hypothetical protein